MSAGFAVANIRPGIYRRSPKGASEASETEQHPSSAGQCPNERLPSECPIRFIPGFLAAHLSWGFGEADHREAGSARRQDGFCLRGHAMLDSCLGRSK